MSPQKIIAVVLCGGSGTRLWPLSTPATPKQFLSLLGEKSTFQTATLRAAAISGVSDILVVSNQTYESQVQAQLAAIGVRAHLLLEPCGRNSGPAIAAACIHIERHWCDAIAVFLSADHYIPDDQAFALAVDKAVAPAQRGNIVTLGLRPTEPSTAFGYILAKSSDDDAARPVAAFFEKPDLDSAHRYMDEGYLWNSGTFIARPKALLDELQLHAPDIVDAASKSVDHAHIAGRVAHLGVAFNEAPARSIDHAVMEKTDRAYVVPADFAWSDVGDWRAVLGVSAKDESRSSLVGEVLALDTAACIVRAPASIKLALIGVQHLAVIVGQDGSILICDLDHSQKTGRAAAWYQGDANNFIKNL